MGMAGASFGMRIMDRDRAVVPKGLALQSAIGGLLMATRWFGGELAYRKRIGVIPMKEEQRWTEEPPRYEERVA